MKFSKHAQDNMLFFLNDAEHYIKKIGPHQQRRLDILLGKLYKDIYNSNTFITSLLRRDLLKAKVIPIHHRNDIPDSDLLNSTFVPRNVKDYIHEKSNYNIQYKCKINLTTNGAAFESWALEYNGIPKAEQNNSYKIACR